jgi:4-hydroxythreonine-4-phosphate dehydrogenase
MKTIAITMGDPAGVGPEIIAKSITNPEIQKTGRLIIVGSIDVMQEAMKLTGSLFRMNQVSSPAQADPSPGAVNIIDPGIKTEIVRNMPSAESGRASVACIERAVDLALKGEVDAVVTAPISKEALKMAGYPWPGHTEMIAEKCGIRDYAMMLIGGPLRVVLVTIHTAIRNVPGLIRQDAVLKTIRLAKKAADMLSIREPKIAVAGLNPHSGEGGIFGTEEIEEIRPAVDAAVLEGLPVSGPYPPDTIFHKAYRGEVDIIVCMYHDQGLIPLKMICFDTGVNITVGLPIIRTSPDHGTAYDIAWKGLARPSSMAEAIRLAAGLKRLNA